MSARILIVDDAALFRTTIRHAVEGAGYEVAGTARNGHQALANLSVLQPDAVILDLEMPGMNGIEFLTALNKDRSIFRPKAILVFSAHSQHAAGITMEALRLGATDFVAKPSGGPAAIEEQLLPKLQALIGDSTKKQILLIFNLVTKPIINLNDRLLALPQVPVDHKPLPKH